MRKVQAVLINKRFVPDPPNALVAPAQMFCLLATATVTKLQYSQPLTLGQEIAGLTAEANFFDNGWHAPNPYAGGHAFKATKGTKLQYGGPGGPGGPGDGAFFGGATTVNPYVQALAIRAEINGLRGA